MKIKSILIFLLIFHFGSTELITNTTESYITIIPLKYKIKLEFFVPTEPEPCEGDWPTPGVFTITAEARNASNRITLPWRNSAVFHSLKVNVTNLTGNKTIPVSNVTKCTEEDELVCILLEDSVQAGDHLEITMLDGFSKMKLFKYYDCDANQTKYYGYYRPSESLPFLGYGNARKDPRIPIQFTVGLGGIWNKSHKIFDSFNSVAEDTDNSLSNITRWIHLEETPPLDIQNAEFFISEFVNYTVSTERNTKVSVLGPPSVIFQNGTKEGSLIVSAYANFTVSLACSILNNYEKILDMKYPLDGLQIIFLDDHPWGRLLGQKYLRQSEFKRFTSTAAARAQAKRYVVDDLSFHFSFQFVPIMVDEPLEDGMDLSYYLTYLYRKGVIDEEFYSMNLLKMMEGFLSPEIVLNGIRIYLKSNIWKRATQENFFDAMEESISKQNGTDLLLPTGVRVKDVIGDYNNLTWYHRQVNASLLNSNHIQLTFGYKNRTKFINGFERWMPVQVKLALSLENCTEILEETFWIPPNTSSVHTITRIGGHTLTNRSEIEWFLVNKNRDGLYSTFYDEKLLFLLASQLNRNFSVFTPWERYNFLVQAGISYYYPDIVDLEKLFILTSYFGQETESYLWHDPLSKLRRSRFLYTGNDEGYLEMRKHFVPRMESYFESRGGLENIENSEKGLDWQLREGCIFLRVPSCLRFASENLKVFEFASESLAEITWFAPAGADPQNFEYLKERFLSVINDRYLRHKYFNALQWISNDTLYESFLNSVVEKNYEALNFEFALPVDTPVFSESRLALLINFARSKFQEEKISSMIFGSVAEYIFRIYRYAEFVADKKLYEDLKLFINSNQEKLERDHYSALQRAITMCDEKVYNPESYWNKNGEKFLLWLKKFNEEGYNLGNDSL